MGRNAKIKAARRLDRVTTQETVTRVQQKAKQETAIMFLEFLQGVRAETAPGITFFDPKANEISFLEASQITETDVLEVLDKTDFLLNRIVSVHVATGWNTKHISLAELEAQIKAVETAIAEAELALFAVPVGVPG